nr:hypothetical protein [Micromonospora sp. DSM 115978]
MLVVALGVPGCGGEGAGPSSPTPARTFAGCPDLTLNGVFDWVKSYRTLDELVVDAEAVVRVRATDRVTVSEISELPFTATEVEVVETVRGTVPPVFPVVQMGAVP